ncbi:MAG: dTMP kinase [Syntrophobacterales bacterium]|nr:dTMP kinase [Syntrophobacterales bacterium]
MHRFITFDGIEGCGKTTQLRLAEAWLRARGLPVLATAEPGGTPLGVKIRELLLNRRSWNIGAEAELLLFAAARAQHVAETIIPALNDGKWVLCDRYTDATVAYQGFGRGINAELIRWLNEFSSHGLEPELTLLFDLPVEAGLRRARMRAAGSAPDSAEDRFEQEETNFHQRVRDGYLQLAEMAPERFRLVNAYGTPEEIQREVRRLLTALLGTSQ